jgi:hypothetical protein
MRRGSWLESADQAIRWEALLAPLDPQFEAFTSRRGLTLERNERESVGRSIRWGDNPRGLIKLFLKGLETDQWKLWLCCANDRDGKRYWRQEYLVDGQPIASFAELLAEFLEQGFDRVNHWMGHPEDLSFATDLSPLPDLRG